MKRKKALTFSIAVLAIIVIALCLNVFVQQKFIRTYTCTEIEYRGYTTKDVAGIRIDHSYIRRILGYNEWRISVEFEKEPNVFFWFTYRDQKIVFEGVSSEPMMNREKAVECSEKFKNGALLR